MKIRKKTIIFLLMVIMILPFTTANVSAEITNINLKDISANNHSLDVNSGIEFRCSHPATRRNCYGNIHSVNSSLNKPMYYCWTAIECDLCGSYLRTEGYHACYEISGKNYYQSYCPY